MIEKREIEYRYYETPPNSYILALLGERWIRPYGTDLPSGSLHFHNLLEVGICRGGEGTMSFINETKRYKEGTITIITPNCPHHTLTDEGISGWEYLFIALDDFTSKEIKVNSALAYKNLFTESHHYITDGEKNPILRQIIELLLDLYRNKPPMYLEMAKSQLMSFVMAVANLSRDKTSLQKSTIEDDSVIVLAIDYIQKNYQNQIKINDIARACHLSETHFRRLFETNMSISPLQYVNLVRIDYACRKLRNTKMPIQNIATDCGFVTLSSFNRNFKNLMGMSPKDWRNAELAQTVMTDSSTVIYNGWL